MGTAGETRKALELRYLQWRCINKEMEKQLQQEEKEYQYLLQCIGNQWIGNSSSFSPQNWLSLWQPQTKQQVHQFHRAWVQDSKKMLQLWTQLNWQAIPTMESWKDTITFYQQNKPVIANQRDLALLERKIQQWIVYLVGCQGCRRKDGTIVDYDQVMQRLLEDCKAIMERIGSYMMKEAAQVNQEKDPAMV